MSVLALEGTVENGQIRLAGGVQLPEKTRVLIVVPSMHVLKEAHLYSPRLVQPAQAADFKLQVIELDMATDSSRATWSVPWSLH